MISLTAKETKTLDDRIRDGRFDNIFDNIGLKVRDTETELDKAKEEKSNQNDSIEERLLLSDLDRDFAVKMSLIPENYKNVKFSEEAVKANLKTQYEQYNKAYGVVGFQTYMRVTSNILSDIRLKKKPKRSWIIGAPNGFGKTSFVTECLIHCLKNAWKVAPYISLTELSELRTEEEQRLMRPFSYELTKGRYDEKEQRFVKEDELARSAYINGYLPGDIVKNARIITSRYSWSEYINADVLFVEFSGIMSKEIESLMFRQLLTIRSSKGLPTIALISTSLDPYIKDKALNNYVWSEVLSYSRPASLKGMTDTEFKKLMEKCEYDRVLHISAYKVRKTISVVKSEDNKTGQKINICDEKTGIISE